LINQIIILTVFEGFGAMENLKVLWLQEIRLGPHWGSLQRSLAEISNILFEIITEMLR